MITRRISVRGVALHEGKLLAVRLKPYNEVSLNMQQSWCLPGGGLVDGESLTDGIKREMLEETGVYPVVGTLLYIQQFSYNQVDYLEFFFHITNGEDYQNIDLAKTSHGAAELEEIAYVDAGSTPLLPVFLMKENLLDKVIAEAPASIFSYPD